MDINSLNGANAYSKSTPPVDNTRVQEQNLEASRSELESQNRSAQAFEVSITQEARDRLETQSAENAQQTQHSEPNNTDSRTVSPAQDASQIVNIVA